MTEPINNRHCTNFLPPAREDCLTVDGFSLATHQLRIISEMKDKGCLGIFAEAGTGKTMIALSWIYDALITGRIETALVVCPASLVASWELAIGKMTQFKGYTDLDVEIMKSAVTILSISSVWQQGRVKGRRCFVKGGKVYHIREGYDREWGAIFIDESHNLGSHASIQTKVCSELLSSCAQYRFVMTGTPDSGKYEKLYGQINFLCPGRWHTWSDFKRECVRSIDRYFKPKTYFVEHCEELKRQYGTVARLRECFDMPSSTETDIPCPLTPSANRAYLAIRKMKGSDYGLGFASSGSAWAKSLQVCSGFVISDNQTRVMFENSKLDALSTIIDGIDGKVVIFCNYTQSIDSVCDLLAKKKIKHHRFDGSVKEPVWQQFQTDDSQAIVLQYQRGGVGIDLFASCNCIFFEQTMRAVILEQAKARIMRKGQTKPCRYYYLYAPSTIEEKLMRQVRSGVDVSSKMLDDWAREERRAK